MASGKLFSVNQEAFTENKADNSVDFQTLQYAVSY
jgi:hypothetical protein